MATIALYADKINQMPSLLNGVKDSIGSLKEELKDLQKTALRVDSGICDLSEVAESVRAATMIEENRVSAIEEFRSRTEEFIRDAVRIDEAVAEAVDRNKDDFYEKYSYLMPDSEKNGWELLIVSSIFRKLYLCRSVADR